MVETKWPPFRRRHFQINYITWKPLYIVCSRGSTLQLISTGSDNGSAPNRRQSFFWASDELWIVDAYMYRSIAMRWATKRSWKEKILTFIWWDRQPYTVSSIVKLKTYKTWKRFKIQINWCKHIYQHLKYTECINESELLAHDILSHYNFVVKRWFWKFFGFGKVSYFNEGKNTTSLTTK